MNDFISLISCLLMLSRAFIASRRAGMASAKSRSASFQTFCMVIVVAFIAYSSCSAMSLNLFASLVSASTVIVNYSLVLVFSFIIGYNIESSIYILATYDLVTSKTSTILLYLSFCCCKLALRSFKIVKNKEIVSRYNFGLMQTFLLIALKNDSE